MASRSETAAVDFGAFVPGEHHIELASGGYLDLADPDPAVISLENVAHGLSHTCRFAGQCARFYSVAEHALLVALRLRDVKAPAVVQLAGLHHDDAEAFIGDVTRPLKALLPAYRGLEESVTWAIGRALDLPAITIADAHAFKAADDWALACEAHKLLPSSGRTWFCADLYDQAADHVSWTLGWPPEDARRLWLERHTELVEEMG